MATSATSQLCFTIAALGSFYAGMRQASWTIFKSAVTTARIYIPVLALDEESIKYPEFV